MEIFLGGSRIFCSLKNLELDDLCEEENHFSVHSRPGFSIWKRGSEQGSNFSSFVPVELRPARVQVIVCLSINACSKVGI